MPATERNRVSEFVTLMKPRVMLLAVFTAFVGLIVAPGHLDPLRSVVSIAAIAAGAGAAGVLNMWYDADIDRLMPRTAMRPIPAAVSRRMKRSIRSCTCCGCDRRSCGLGQPYGAGLLALAILFYVVVYTHG